MTNKNKSNQSNRKSPSSSKPPSSAPPIVVLPTTIKPSKASSSSQHSPLPSSPSSPSPIDAVTRHIASADTQTRVVTSVVATVVAALIVWLAVTWWKLVEPFAMPLFCASCLSVALHEVSSIGSSTSSTSTSTSSPSGHQLRYALLSATHMRALATLILETKDAVELYSKKRLFPTVIATNKHIINKKSSSVAAVSSNNFWRALKSLLLNSLVFPLVTCFCYIRASIIGVYNRPSDLQIPSSAAMLFSFLGFKRGPKSFLDQFPRIVRGVFALTIVVVTTARLLQFVIPDFWFASLTALIIHAALPMSILMLCIIWRLLFVRNLSPSSSLGAANTNNSNTDRLQQEINFVRSVRLLIITAQVALFLSLFTASSFTEIKVYSEPIVDAIKPLLDALQISDVITNNKHNILTKKDALIKLLLTEDTTIKLNEAISDFNSRFDFSNLTFTRLKDVFYQIGDRHSFLHEQIGDTDSLFYTLFRNHSDTFSKAFDETVARGQPFFETLRAFLGSTLGFLTKSTNWLLTKTGEAVLFFTTLTTLMSLDKTIIYYFLRKFLTLVFGDKKRAEEAATETEAVVVFELHSFFHKKLSSFIFHFILTLLWNSLTQVPLAVTFSAIVSYISLLNSARLIRPALLQVGFCFVMWIVKSKIFLDRDAETRFFEEEEFKWWMAIGVVSSSMLLILHHYYFSSSSTSDNNYDDDDEDKDEKQKKNNDRDYYFNSPNSPLIFSSHHPRQRHHHLSTYFFTMSTVLAVYAKGLSGIFVGPGICVLITILWDAMEVNTKKVNKGNDEGEQNDCNSDDEVKKDNKKDV